MANPLNDAEREEIWYALSRIFLDGNVDCSKFVNVTPAQLEEIFFDEVLLHCGPIMLFTASSVGKDFIREKMIADIRAKLERNKKSIIARFIHKILVGFYRRSFLETWGQVKDEMKKPVELMRAAEQGDADAQFEMGRGYRLERFGMNTKKNHVGAFKWMLKAAEQGHIKAQYKIGEMYFCGSCVAKSYTKAVEWIQKAAEQGDEEAQFRFGIMYEKGWGVEQNFIKAVEWFTKAAEQDYFNAPFELALIYQEE
jgi:predicted secreted protein